MTKRPNEKFDESNGTCDPLLFRLDPADEPQFFERTASASWIQEVFSGPSIVQLFSEMLPLAEIDVITWILTSLPEWNFGVLGYRE